MAILLTLIIGTAIGGFGSYWLTKRKEADYILLNIFFGVSGSLVGLGVWWIAFSTSADTGSLLNVSAILCSLIGALIITLGFNSLYKIMPKPDSSPELPKKDKEDRNKKSEERQDDDES